VGPFFKAFLVAIGCSEDAILVAVVLLVFVFVFVVFSHKYGTSISQMVFDKSEILKGFNA
jgi:hypothetical protein